MPRTPARVTQADISRALRAVKDSGMTLAVEVAPDGTIRIVPHQKVETPPELPQLDRRRKVRL